MEVGVEVDAEAADVGRLDLVAALERPALLPQPAVRRIEVGLCGGRAAASMEAAAAGLGDGLVLLAGPGRQQQQQQQPDRRDPSDVRLRRRGAHEARGPTVDVVSRLTERRERGRSCSQVIAYSTRVWPYSCFLYCKSIP
eukprot:SAG11_NODE_6264_length_1348_cov_2.123299_3_plen_140_part_00